MPLHQNSTDDTDDIGESLDNLGNLRQKESEKVDGASENEYEDLPFYEAESGASETDEEDTEERPPPPPKKKKTKAEAVSDLNELIVAEVGKTGLEMTSKALDYTIRQHLGIKRAFKDELEMKKHELNIREREIALKEREILLQESADAVQEKKARIRRIELENRRMELENTKLERDLGLNWEDANGF